MELQTQNACLNARFGWKASIDILAEAGYKKIDYSLADVGSAWDRFTADNWKEIAIETRRYVDSKEQVIIGQTHMPFHIDWSKLDLGPDMEHCEIFGYIVRAIEISAILGAKIAVMHPIHHMVYEGHADELRELNFRYFRALIPYCREYGVVLAIENMFQKDKRRKICVPDVCSDVEEHIQYIDTLDSEYITACLDVGHVGLVYGNEPDDSIRRLGHDRLGALHICDNDFTADQHTLCGLGIIDWKKIMQALADIDYSGDFTYEADGGFLGRFPDYLIKEATRFMYNIGNILINLPVQK